MIEGIIYRYRHGIACHDLPKIVAPWLTVWTWRHCLADEGTRDITTVHTLIPQADAERLVDRSASAGSRSRAHQCAPNVTNTTDGWIEPHESAHRA